VEAAVAQRLAVKLPLRADQTAARVGHRQAYLATQAVVQAIRVELLTEAALFQAPAALAAF
jgi:hypothetical protein